MEKARLSAKGVILIRVDGGSQEGLGLGHIYRCLNMAMVLKNKFRVIFLIRKYPEVSALIRKNGFSVICLRGCSGHRVEIKKISELISSFGVRLFIADIRNVDDAYVRAIKGKGCYFVYFDDLGRQDLSADIIINPGPYAGLMRYSHRRTTKYLLGLRYFILNHGRGRIKRSTYKVRKKILRICLSFGGADPKGASFKVLRFLKNFDKRIKFTLILGHSYKGRAKIRRYIRSNRLNNFTIKENVKYLLGFFRTSDMAVVSAGDTLLEALYAGVPVLAVPTIWYEDRIADALRRRGVLAKTAQVKRLKKGELIKAAEAMINDYPRRLRMSMRAKGLIDGKGVKRVCCCLESLVNLFRG